jgi:hypothetical protein
MLYAAQAAALGYLDPGARVPGEGDTAIVGKTAKTTGSVGGPSGPGSPGKRAFGLTTGEWVMIIVAIIGLIGVLGAPTITGWFSSRSVADQAEPTPAAPSTTPSAAPSPTSGPPEYQDELDGLASKDAAVWKKSIQRLASVVTDKSESPQGRQIVLRSLAAFVRTHAPKTLARSYDYCLKDPPPLYVPHEVEFALQTIGTKLPEDDELVINLTGINIAYASLPDLNLRNVRLDGSLLCRAILVKSRLDGASFRNTNLRFSWMQESQGITADQLALAASLQKVELPAYLADSPMLTPMLVKDPELNAF